MWWALCIRSCHRPMPITILTMTSNPTTGRPLSATMRTSVSRYDVKPAYIRPCSLTQKFRPLLVTAHRANGDGRRRQSCSCGGVDWPRCGPRTTGPIHRLRARCQGARVPGCQGAMHMVARCWSLGPGKCSPRRTCNWRIYVRAPVPCPRTARLWCAFPVLLQVAALASLHRIAPFALVAHVVPPSPAYPYPLHQAPPPRQRWVGFARTTGRSPESGAPATTSSIGTHSIVSTRASNRKKPHNHTARADRARRSSKASVHVPKP
ncbi:hypothetical protein L227DRAFT_172766 [Lentinus tigrinus ALCF2SS1-6]|uniref:Uncharacterized protein n=1 Tax=Lentinus tigrinus ALCF2SS1-6 TaxID=1328759 RepID=A0A5C2SCI5_9APHY|nr:hypothetical protein L227DRAFT_172766 [Lentinus tigrinus ALCF2SS1-6]